MFEPLKLISLGLTLLLLAPFGLIFWLLATHPGRSDAERRSLVEASTKEQTTRLGSTEPGGGIVGGVGVTITESLAFSEKTARWLSFYPRRWVGWLGLAAVAVTLFCMVLSLFFPGASAMSASAWHQTPSSPPTPTQ